MSGEVTRAELLRQSIERLRAIAAECGLHLGLALHVDDELPAALGPLPVRQRFVSGGDPCVSYELGDGTPVIVAKRKAKAV